jgi:hypothetical protein
MRSANRVVLSMSRTKSAFGAEWRCADQRVRVTLCDGHGAFLVTASGHIRIAADSRGHLAPRGVIWASANVKARSARPRKSAHHNRPTLPAARGAASMVPVIV